MRYSLENDTLKITIDTHGAELCSVFGKSEQLEYMWQADPKYWGRTSPVLFPFVGSLKNKQYYYDGKTYPMGQHGFARDMEFAVISQTADSILFRLTETEETLTRFPFRFTLEIGYTLKDNTVSVLWRVINPDTKDLLFSIGAHPAFNCPLFGESDKVGYSVGFGDKDLIVHHGNDRKTGLSMREHIELPLIDGKAVITPGFFDRCTYIIEERQTNDVSLVTPNGRSYINVHFDTPLFAVWSPEEKNAPFVCIEPWFGRCDAEDFNGSLEDREFGNRLLPGDLFETTYDISFN